MSRSFTSTLRKMARESEKASRALERQLQREVKALERQRVLDIKEQQRLYVESRMEDVAERNQDIEQQIRDLESLLTDGIATDPTIHFDSLLISAGEFQSQIGRYAKPLPVPERHTPKKPNIFLSWIPGSMQRYEALVKQADENHQIALTKHSALEIEREEKITEIRSKTNAHNEKIKDWERAFRSGQPEAVAEYFDSVLADSEYPEGFPQTSRIVYVPQSKQLVIEYLMPELSSIVPEIKSYKYVKSSDSVTDTKRPESQQRAIYASIVAQVTIRSLWEIIKADSSSNLIDTIVYNGYVETINPATGQQVKPCLVSVRAAKDAFSTLNLQRVEPIACLQALNASFSKSPAELAPVRPILELNMVDPRFIQESDVLSTLDQRPNLMDLTPNEFESLITNLFQKMGLETKLTQASRDGGVDCVAFDPRPIFGGKVVIQAKRYKNTVGVSAVRDLFGTMQNEGASKGILVATSGYGKAAFEFANGKPIELLDGGNLLYLLNQHANIEAKIVMPSE